jgi:TonB-linked SusC/RagA family outer membrane protein
MNKELLDQNRAERITFASAQAGGGLARRMKCLLVLLLLLCATLPLSLRAQNLNISGTVRDGNGDPVAGASVVVKGATVGVTTDAGGGYTISAPADATLVFSFLGLATKEEAVAGRGRIDVALGESDQTLDEIVVVGYGTARKKDLTGSVVQILPDRIANENPKTVQDILRGTPGLQVGYNASAKGGGNMQIRGQRSVYTDGGHNNPLLILDGMIFYGELSEINPDDIAQIDVLKDASSAAVYGAQAASGVILITTKKGKQGKPVVNVATNIGWTQRSDYRERFTPEENLQHRQDFYTKSTYGVNPETGAYEAYQALSADKPGYYTRPGQLPSNISINDWRGYTTNEDGESDLSIWAKRVGFMGNTLENLLAGKTVDWANLTYRIGFNQDYNASISGAGEKVNYYLSMGYLKNQGANISDEYQAVRANMKVEAKVNKWFEVGANVNFQNRSDGEIGVDLDYQLRNSPYADYADENGNPVQYPLSSEYSQRGYNYAFDRKYLELEKGYTVLNSILNAKVTLPFNVTYSFNAAPRYQYFYDRYFMSAELPGSDPATRGANREQAKRFDWSLNNTISWDYAFAEKHRVNVTLVQEAEERQYWQDRIEARKILPSDALGFHNTKNGTKENSTFSSNDSHQTADALLTRLFYAFDNRYMLTTSIRRDGYSAFGQSNPYATFPSIAVAWTFTNEKFFEKWSDVLSNGKLRVSYGENGNRSLDNPYLALANLYEGAGKMQGYINSSGEVELLRYLMAQRLANPFLQWEKTESWNFGFDFGLFNDRITGSVEYYTMSTHDMIMNQRLPEFTGFNNITTNLGQVDNRGVEISISSLNIKNDVLEWSTSLGFSYNKNEIKHLYYENEDVLDESGGVIGAKEMDDKTNGWFIGQPISAIWDYRVTGIWQLDEVEEAKKYGQLPGDPKVANNYTADDKVNPDGSVTPVYNDKDKEFLGQTAPPIHWSLRNDFVLWKDLSLSFNLYSYMGHKRLANYYLNHDDDGGRFTYAMANLPAKEYWTLDNPTNDYGRIDAKGPAGAEGAQKLYDCSFIRLENISVGYTLPKSWTSTLDLERVKIYGSIRNVAVWAFDWEYGDPETDPAFDQGGGLATRIYTMGLNITF